jgi:Raf kinase inhibitor-like YbhB/YbcL family protein
MGLPLVAIAVSAWLAVLPVSRADAVETRLKSRSFGHGKPIPKRHTCDGLGVSPPLSWPAPPKTAKTLVVIAEDPTTLGSGRAHWVLYDLPADTVTLPANLPPRPSLDNGAKQGKNDLGKIGYAAPCPEPGELHQYWFRIYAVDAPLGLPPGATASEVKGAMLDHVVWVSELMGTYQRAAQRVRKGAG